MSAKKLKAKLTWANPDRLHCPLTALSSVNEPHFVIPATPEAIKQMREQVAKAICDGSRNWPGAWESDAPASAKESYRMDADAALAALGLTKRCPVLAARAANNGKDGV